MRTAFIYGLRCPLTGLIRYIGKCDKPKKRLPEHLSDPEINHRTNWFRALTKQGLKPTLEVIAEVPWDAWPFWERSYIRAYRCLGFDLVNSTDGGEGSLNPSKETRAKLRAARLGKKLSPAQCAAISARTLGKKASPETLQKLSISHKGVQAGEKHPMFGKKHTSEALAKMSAALLGKKLSPEHCAKMSIARRGLKKKNNTSGFVGVGWGKERKKWVAYIKLNGKHASLGRFSKIEDAVFVRNLAFDKYYGNHEST